MFIFLKLINTAHYRENRIKSANTIDDVKKDVKKLIDILSSIELDFNKMDAYFEKKYDKLIQIHKNEFKKKVFPLEETKSKVQCNKYESNECYPVPSKSEYRNQIFGKIVFRNFLKFYDEYSYAINERIKEIYETTFERIKGASENFYDLEKLSFRSGIDHRFLKYSKYLNLHYFRKKLEEKLAKDFKINISGIRNILYGCNSRDECLQEKHIEKYYDTLLNYKRFCRAKYMDINKFFENLYYHRPLTSQERTIKTFMTKYAHYLNCELPDLYSYHNTILIERFTLSETRFILYDQMLFNHHGRWKHFPSVFEGEDKLFFAKYELLQEDDDLELGLRRQIFEHVSYSEGNTNVYRYLFNEMKSVLVPPIYLVPSL